MPRRLPTTYARLTPERRAELEAEFRAREMEDDPSSFAADVGVAVPAEVGIGGGRVEVSLPEPMSVDQVLEPFLAEHYAAEEQLKAEAADRALMGQFAADRVLLDEQFAVERQIAEEADSDSDSDFEFSDEDEEEEDVNGAGVSGSAPVGTGEDSGSDFDFTSGEEDVEDDDMEEAGGSCSGSGSAPSATDAGATVNDAPSATGTVSAVVVISDDDE